MTRVLFIGHDQGAAAMLLPVIRDMVADGEAIALAAAGPAAALWDRLPAPVLSPDGDGEDWWGGYLDRLRPELVVTGTGHYSDFERNCWRAARNIGIRTVAVIDAWVNFAERFERTADLFKRRVRGRRAVDRRGLCEQRSEEKGAQRSMPYRSWPE